MSVKISQLSHLPTLWGNVSFPLVSKLSGANVTYVANVDQINSFISNPIYTAIDGTASFLNANIVLANLTLRVYTDGQITAANTGIVTANVGMKGYVDYNNSLTISYVDGQITAANTGIVTANVGMKGYVDFANTIQQSYINGQITAANAGVTAANVGMRGYVDFANATQKAYITGQINAANAGVTAANVGMQGYVDFANTIQQSYINGQITAANTGVTLANVNMKGYVDGQIAAANAGVNTANVGMKGYVDQANSIQQTLITNLQTSAYSNVNAIAYLTSFNSLVNNTGNLMIAGNTALFGNTFHGTVGVVSGQFHTFVGNINQFTSGGAVYINTGGNVMAATGQFGNINSSGYINTLGNLSNGGNTFHAGNTFQGTVGAISGQFHTFVGNITQSTSGGPVYFNTSGNIIATGNLSIGGNTALAGNLTIGTFGSIPGGFHNVFGNITQNPSATGSPVYLDARGNLMVGGTTTLFGTFSFPSISVPASAANSPGRPGQITWDSGFIYVCINANTWRRVAIASW